MTYEQCKKWDNFIHEMLICTSTAQKRFKYFILSDLDPNEPYDLFFFKMSLFSNTFIRSCKLYGYFTNIFKFLKFKYKERKVHKAPWKVMLSTPNDYTHICSKEERVELIEEIAKKHDIHPEEIPMIYKEYYTK